MKKLLLVLVLPLLMGAGCATVEDNQAKFNRCVQICVDTYPGDPWGEKLNVDYMDCRQICVEKNS